MPDSHFLAKDSGEEVIFSQVIEEPKEDGAKEKMRARSKIDRVLTPWGCRGESMP